MQPLYHIATGCYRLPEQGKNDRKGQRADKCLTVAITVSEPAKHGHEYGHDQKIDENDSGHDIHAGFEVIQNGQKCHRHHAVTQHPHVKYPLQGGRLPRHHARSQPVFFEGASAVQDFQNRV